MRRTVLAALATLFLTTCGGPALASDWVGDKGQIAQADSQSTTFLKRLDGKDASLEFGALMVWDKRMKAVVLMPTATDYAPSSIKLLTFYETIIGTQYDLDDAIGFIHTHPKDASAIIPWESRVYDLINIAPSPGDYLAAGTIIKAGDEDMTGPFLLYIVGPDAVVRRYEAINPFDGK